MTSPLLQTTVVGSFPQPDCLVDRDTLKQRLVPRVRAPELWRIAAPYLTDAQDDATRLAVLDMERAGIDIITDGEIRRESYSNHFAMALDGVDASNPATVTGRNGKPTQVPRVIGPIRRLAPVEARDMGFLRANTDRKTKITLPGPFTMAQQAHDDHYDSDEAMAMAFADAVNAEARDLFAAGADYVQIDEPWLQARPDAAKRFGVAVINRALRDLPGPTIVHLCFGYAQIVSDKPSGYSFLPQLADSVATAISIEAAQPRLDLGVLADLRGKQILLGVLDLGTPAVETADEVAARIRAGLAFVAPANLFPAPDCGMKYLSRDRAIAKLCVLSEGAAIVRRELA